MVVTTASPRAKTRAGWLWRCCWLISERGEAHDRSAHFWDMAEKNGVSQSRFPKLEQERVPLLDASHVAMRVNLDACISCGLCVRACREVQVNDVIGMAGRGHDAFPVFDQDDAMGGEHMRRLRRMCAGLPPPVL